MTRLPFAAPFAIIPVAAAAGVVARSSAPQIELGDNAVSISLLPQGGAHRGRCFVTVDGMTAAHPVGASFDIAVATPDTARMSVGTLSFYDSIGLPASASAPLSFAVPAAYCAASGVVVIAG